VRYGNLISDHSIGKYRNYGDDYQLFAIEQLYNMMGVDYREVVRLRSADLASYEGDYIVLPINFMIANSIYPRLSPKIIPVYLGLNLLDSSIGEAYRFHEFEPIGCRDAYTMHVLQDAGYRAYLNGCMTLTFPRRQETEEQTKVFIVDADEKMMPFMPEHLLDDAVFVSQGYFNHSATEDDARALLNRYRDEARLVVTQRLHCAVPCMAMGIPVIFARRRISHRSWWLENLIDLYDQSTFNRIDWNPKPLELEAIKQNMIDNAIRRITGAHDEYASFFDLSSYFENNNPPNYVIDLVDLPLHYIRENWAADRTQPYVLWGKTQIAEYLFRFIQDNYPKAHLIGMIDLYRNDAFHGYEPQGVELLDSIGDATLFVCTESANLMAREEYAKRQNRGGRARARADRQGACVLCWATLVPGWSSWGDSSY
jgi:hypothetical protein